MAKGKPGLFSKGHKPQKLQTNCGTEFLNQPLNKLLNQCNVYHFVPNNEVKTSVMEHFNRTLKTKMWRYFTAHTDVLS